jgi:hypothetical protein
MNYTPTAKPAFQSALSSKDIRDEFSAIATAINSKLDSTASDLDVATIKIAGPLSSDVNTLDRYEEGTYTATMTGVVTPVPVTASYTVIGNVVTIRLPNAADTYSSGVVRIEGLPASLWPVVPCDNLISVISDGVVQLGVAHILTNGNIVLLKNLTSVMTGPGLCGYVAAGSGYTKLTYLLS